MRKTHFNILVAVCVFMMTLTGQVADGGTIYVPADFNSIQAAIDAAASYGDEIEVAPGTYNEAINFGGKAVRLYSSGGTDVTTIDANGIAGAYHVVQCVSGEGPSTVLEGFTITGGNANGLVYPDDCGGGMYNKYSSPTVTNCIFTGNTAVYGGGGMYNEESDPTVTNCIFIDNTTAGAGGGMLNERSNPTVTNCTFSVNEASNGGGMLNQSDSNPTVTNCRFNENEANKGGGMLNQSRSRPIVTNCIFSGNTAGNSGGGMYNHDSQLSLRNCTLTDNTAFIGGGMLNRRSGSTLTNCILWGDTPDEIFDIEITAWLYYCDIQGGWTGTGDNNIDADPLFVDANNPDPNLRSLRLKPDSPCVDAGDSTMMLNERIYLDLDGKHRYVDIDSIDDIGHGPLEFLDIGAYEFNCNYTAGDSNCDGLVNFKDLAILAANWLAGTEPEL